MCFVFFKTKHLKSKYTLIIICYIVKFYIKRFLTLLSVCVHILRPNTGLRETQLNASMQLANSKTFITLLKHVFTIIYCQYTFL